MDLFICNLSAGIMIILTLAMRRIARYRIPNSVFCLLWGMIGVRLLFPVQVRTPWSILNVYFHFRNKPVLIDYSPKETVRSVIMERIETAGALVERHGNILTVLGLIGCCVMAVYFITGYFLLWKDVKEAKPLEGVKWMKDCIAEQKIRRTVLLKRDDDLDTPVTCGMIRPVILVPTGFEMEDRELSRLVLLHECGHIKYFHFVFRAWNTILLCLYWYNPLIWVMYLKFERDLEISADRYALRHTEGDKKWIYAKHLVATAERISMGKRMEAVYHFCRNNDTRERIEAIMRFRKMGAGAIIATILIPMGMTTAFATTNVVLKAEEASVAIESSYIVDMKDAEIEVVAAEMADVEEMEPVSITVDWKEVEPYIDFENQARASYLVLENYTYTTYGKLPPQSITIRTTFEGHTYEGTLNRTDYTYNDATDKYVGYYSGKIYRQD